MKTLSFDEGFSRMAALCSVSEHCESEIREKLQKAGMFDADIQRLTQPVQLRSLRIYPGKTFVIVVKKSVKVVIR